MDAVEGGEGGLRLNKSALRLQIILLRHSLSGKDFEIDGVLGLEGTVRDDVASGGRGELLAFSLHAPQVFFVDRDLLRKLPMLSLLIENLRLKGFLLRARHNFTQIALLLQQGLLLREAINRPPDCRSGDGIGFTIYDKEELTFSTFCPSTAALVAMIPATVLERLSTPSRGRRTPVAFTRRV
jgi:hypothetical protein